MDDQDDDSDDAVFEHVVDERDPKEMYYERMQRELERKDEMLYQEGVEIDQRQDRAQKRDRRPADAERLNR